MPTVQTKSRVHENNGQAAPSRLVQCLRRQSESTPQTPRRVKPTNVATVADGFVTGRLSDVEPAPVTWEWRNRIPRGKFSIIQGDPGRGKTTVGLDIIAHVTTGKPFCDGAPCEQAEALFVTAEDGIADTIRPRLDLLGADPGKVHWLDVVRSGGKSVALDLDRHLEMLGDWLAGHPMVRIVVFDPLAAFMGQLDTHRNSDVRGILGRIAKLAESYNVAVVAISHLTKAMMSAIHRSVGSIAFVAAARAVWQVCADRDDQNRRLFLPVKMNLARASGLAFRITDHGIAWETGAVEVSADDAEADQGDTPRAEAKAWLCDLLKRGPCPAKKVEDKAREDGICLRTLKYAKRELGIESTRHNGKWSWHFPKSAKLNTQPPYPLTRLAASNNRPTAQGGKKVTNSRVQDRNNAPKTRAVLLRT